MSEIVTEYLICIDNKISLFVNEQSIKDFLGLNKRDEFTVEANRIIFENIAVDYSIILNQSSKERIFNLKIVYKQEDIDNDKHFASCLNLRDKIRETIGYLPKVKICPLWDDLSFKQSKEAYSYIYEVENLMRKLITKFMVINVGTQWAASEKVKTKKTNNINIGDAPDALYKLDFIELTDILLGHNRAKFSDEDVTKVYQKIFKAKTSTELDINELKNVVSLSIWQKYFSDLIHYDHKKLQADWEKLYDLRCKIAHNNFLDKNDYQSISDLTKELKTKLESAIENLEQIKLTEEERESISETSRDIINKDTTIRLVINDEERRPFSDLNERLIEANRISDLTRNERLRALYDMNEAFLEASRKLGRNVDIKNVSKKINAGETVSELPTESGDNLIEGTEDIEDNSLNEEN